VSEIKIASFDPSLRNWGVALTSFNTDTGEILVSKLNLIQPDTIPKKELKGVRKSSDDLRRARILHAGVADACAGCAIAIAEVPFGAQSSRAALSNGVVMGILSSIPIPLIEVTPAEVKLTTVGSKTASKAEMIKWATEKHPEAGWLMRKLKGEMVFKNDNEHLADAVCATYAGINTEQFRGAMEMLKSFGMTV